MFFSQSHQSGIEIPVNNFNNLCFTISQSHQSGIEITCGFEATTNRNNSQSHQSGIEMDYQDLSEKQERTTHNRTKVELKSVIR